MTDLAGLSARRKAAIMLLRLGSEGAGPLLRSLRQSELAAVVQEVASLGRIDMDLADAVLVEFVQAAEGDALPSGDIDLAFKYLESTFGERRARELMGQLDGSAPNIPFQFLDSLEAEVIAENLSGEQPQTIALVLSHLTPEISASIISFLPAEIIVQVGFRLGMMDRVTSDALEAVEEGVKERFSAVLENKFLDATGGIDSLVELLTLTNKVVEDVIMEGLIEVDRELAAEVRAKMFTFADLRLLDDRDMQAVLRSVDTSRLPLALKGVADVVRDKVLNNLSSRAKENLLDEIELLGSVRMTDVEEAQSEILETVRQLEETGTIVINRGGDDFVT
ncbi:MAG: flagellar motor switch protein FliG [Actinomycetia bacterium]|nr:flagellar motor switch protein FliG [Actinomycetes bacterium]